MSIVTLDIEEYNRMRDAFDHRKEVKITRTSKSRKDPSWEGESIEWMSDGKCWLHLANKLDKVGLRLADKVKELKKLKKMSTREFRKWQKEEINI